MQDDYCYSVILANRSFWQGQIDSYLHETTYAGNRFSLTLGLALSELAGRWTVPILPGLAILLFVAGLYGVIRRIHDVGGPTLNKIQALLAAAAIALFTISTAPNWVQVIYWRTGMFTYFAPLVSGTYLALVLLDAGKRRKWRRLLMVGAFALALLTGGFSETAAVVQVTALALALLIASLTDKKYRPWLFPLGAALAGGVLAIVLLLLSPANATRWATSYSAPSDLRTTLAGALYNAVYFYVYTAYRQTLPYLFVFLFFGLFALLDKSLQQNIRLLSNKSLVLWMVIWLGVAFLLTAAAMAPSQYVESSYPGARALIIPRFVSVVAGAAISSLAGGLVGKWLNNQRRIRLTLIAESVIVVLFLGFWLTAGQNHLTPPAYPDMRTYVHYHWVVIIGFVFFGLILGGLLVWRVKNQVALAILFGICLLEPLLVANRVYIALPAFRDRAVMWDQREEQILMARANGEQEITVRALDSLAGIAELSDNSDYWVNNCAERYYGVKSLRAVEPVLNHFKSLIP